MPKLSHISGDGKAKMVDVSGKSAGLRSARARAVLKLTPRVSRAIRDKSVPKGDVFATARVAGIMGAKKTPELIPLCHQIPLDEVEIDFELKERELLITAIAKTEAKTGVEMEALTAAALAALTLYDMVKGLDKGCTIADLHLVEKTGGKSGTYKRKLK